jgi:hypothetical protein
MNMSKANDHEFRIEWDLHELGPRPQQAPPHIAHGPKDPVRLLFALAVAHGDVPANTPNLKDKAA